MRTISNPMHEGPGRTARIAVAVCLALATAATYAGILRADFLTIDDPTYVVKNEHVLAGLTLDGVLWAFRACEGGNWHPLTWITHMLDVQLFGLRPWGHHATNLALHVASTVLLLFGLDRLTRAFWPSALVAALFALHPLHVESVAWVSERKDVLSAFFFMLVLLAYARYAENPSRGRYLGVVGLFTLGLMSKPMLVTLPFVLLLLDHWPLGRTTRGSTGKLVREKIPLFVLAASASLTAYLVQKATGAVAPGEALRLPVRASNALVSCLLYLIRTFWPVDLAAYYPHPKAIEPLPALAALAVLSLVSWVAVRERRRRPFLWVGWLWYLVMLVPVIGIIQVGGQARADRYTYIPLVGFFVMLAWSLRGIQLRPPWSVAPILLALALVTRHQVGYWRSTRTLFAHAVEVTGENSVAQQCLGNGLMIENDLDGAMAHLTEALRITPDLPDAHNNLGVVLGARGKYEEAVQHFRAELRAFPRSPRAHFNLGLAFVNMGRIDEGIVELEEALQIAPDLFDAHNNLGTALGAKGRFEEAEKHFRIDLRAHPRSAEAHSNLGFALVNQGRIEEGIAEYEEALRIEPDHFHANSKLGMALGSQGKLAEALAHFEKALAKRQDDAETRRWVAVTLTLRGQVEEGIAQYRKLLEADPNDLDAMNNIAWIRATHDDPAHRDADEAVTLAERARDRSPEENAVLLDTLAAAYAEAGRFDEAVATCEKAIAIARGKGQEKDAQRFEQQLAFFREHHPFRVQ